MILVNEQARLHLKIGLNRIEGLRLHKGNNGGTKCLMNSDKTSTLMEAQETYIYNS